MGTWIEILDSVNLCDWVIGRSLRGNVDRNHESWRGYWECRSVVPYVGTWIEISDCQYFAASSGVVPYVGTWIEINEPRTHDTQQLCRSLRGNVDRNDIGGVEPSESWKVVPYVGTWIEINDKEYNVSGVQVVPYVGTWIEIETMIYRIKKKYGRSLRGNVDRN